MNIPNLRGCYNYNPKTNPLKGLTKDEQNQIAYEYMAMWLSEEDYTDFNALYESGDQDLAADWLVSAGAINSKSCYESCGAIELLIEGWAKSYRKSSRKTQLKRLNSALGDYTTYACQDCNYVQFVQLKYSSNTHEDFLECWECRSKNIEVK